MSYALMPWPPGLALQDTRPRSDSQSAKETLIDINSANLNELMKAPGMTRTWAARIIRFRPYRTKNDLLENGIVTSQVYDRIRNSVIAHRTKAQR